MNRLLRKKVSIDPLHPLALKENQDDKEISKPDPRTFAWLYWKRTRPQISRQALRLLAGAGDISVRLHHLDWPLIVYIANFLYPSDDNAKKNRSYPLEWQILNALYQQLDTTSPRAPTEEQLHDKLYLARLFSIAFKKPTERKEEKSHEPINHFRLIQAMQNESKHAVTVCAARLSTKLVEKKSYDQLTLLFKLGESSQKTLILFYILETAQAKYSYIQSNHNKQDQEYYAAYEALKTYFSFIITFGDPWIAELKKQNNLSKDEQKIISDYPHYFCVMEKTVKEFAPKPAIKKPSAWAKK